MEKIILTKENMLEIYRKLVNLDSIEIQNPDENGKFITTAIGTLVNALINLEHTQIVLYIKYRGEDNAQYGITLKEKDILYHPDETHFINEAESYKRIFKLKSNMEEI
jgi:hypothetical protein